MLTTEEISATVGPVLRRALEPFGLRDLEFSFGRDHDGDEIIVAKAIYAQEYLHVDPIAMLDAVNVAMRILAEKGDQRFLHLQHIHNDGQASDEAFQNLRPRKRRSARS